ncbi:hypothetical protein ACP70R_026117 [Stipagrostis hirtigluma subsp. patula]
MASVGYSGDQGAAYRYSYSAAPAPAPRETSFHLILFLATAALLGATSLYSRCESAVESLVDQVRVAVVLSPLVLLLAVQYWAATAGRRASGGGLSSLLVAPLVGDQPWAYQQRDGGDASSPWGVAMVLALVLLLVSYQSCFHDLWFPLISRR